MIESVLFKDAEGFKTISFSELVHKRLKTSTSDLWEEVIVRLKIIKANLNVCEQMKSKRRKKKFQLLGKYDICFSKDDTASNLFK